jgi:hypothetical protein
MRRERVEGIAGEKRECENGHFSAATAQTVGLLIQGLRER